MSSWQTPKTNWGQPGQTVPGVDDFNRIEGNAQHLNDTLASHKATSATTSQKGHVQLSNSTSSTSTSLAATASAVKTVNDALVSHKAENATDAHKISNITGLQTELDKKASNKNLLVNWDFRNPVNQRGFTSTTNAGYTIDRWQLVTSGHTVEVVPDGIKLIAGKNAGLNLCFQQFIENFKGLEGKTLTLSMHIVENTLTQGCNLRWNDYAGPVIMGTGYFSHTFTPSSLSRLQVGLQFNNRDVDDGKYVIIDKMKLELGSISTLANDPPAVYSEQLAFCGSIILTATLNTPWSGTSAPYTKTVSVSGILATDTPIIDVVMSGTYSTDEVRIEAWGYIYRAVTANGSITFYATEKPTVSLPIQIKVVR